MRLAIITAGPICKLKRSAPENPNIKQNTDITAEKITTLLKLPQIRIAERVGKIISPDMRIAPIKLIPKTIVTAVSTAISIL